MYSLILHRRRFSELQKWRNLRFAVKLVQNASPFSSTTSTNLQDSPKGQNFTVSYLIDSLRLTTKLAESVSRKVQLEEKGNADSVLSLLRSIGFSSYQVASIIIDYPKVLTFDAEKYLGPKLKLLESKAASEAELIEIVSTVPEILGKKCISVYYDSVKCIIEADYVKLTDSFPSSLENKVRNVYALRELGMPQRLLLPLLISKAQPICGKENFDASLKKVVEMGFDPTTPKFVLALRMLYQMSDKTIQEKIEVYKSIGFTEEGIWEIFKSTPTFLKVSKNKILSSMETFLGLGFSKDEFLMMVKRYPPCIEYSTELVVKKIEFVLKEMNWPVKAVAFHPQVAGYSFEKRIVPRCNVIKALVSKGLFGKGSELPPLASVLSATDRKFINKYVLKYDKLVPELMSIYTGQRVS